MWPIKQTLELHGSITTPSLPKKSNTSASSCYCSSVQILRRSGWRYYCSLLIKRNLAETFLTQMTVHKKTENYLTDANWSLSSRFNNSNNAGNVSLLVKLVFGSLAALEIPRESKYCQSYDANFTPSCSTLILYILHDDIHAARVAPLFSRGRTRWQKIQIKIT